MPRYPLTAPKGLPAMTPAMSEKGGQADTTPEILNRVGIAQHLNYSIAAQPHVYRRYGQRWRWALFRQAARDFGAGLLPVPNAVLGRAERPDQRLEDGRFGPGKDFNIIVISIDPTEGTGHGSGQEADLPEDATGIPETANGWHFLTGTQPNIDAIT